MRLSNVYGNGMVFQRDCDKNVIKGILYTEEELNNDNNASINCNNIEIKVVATDENGNEAFAVREVINDNEFRVSIPSMSKGGPFEVTVSAIVNDENVKIEDVKIIDVYFGDVFMLAGQSNMELMFALLPDMFKSEYKKIANPMIRSFILGRNTEFNKPNDIIDYGNWIVCDEYSLDPVSILAFFVADKLAKEKDVYVGLYHTAVGGVPIETYLSEESIRELNINVDLLEKAKVPGYIREINEAEVKRDTEWILTAKEVFKDLEAIRNNGSKGIVEVPGDMEEYKDFVGSLMLEKKFVIDEEDKDYLKDAKLYLGAIVDADDTFINDHFVGNTEYRYPPRIYRVEDGILNVGENTVRINMLVFRKNGKFVGGMRYYLLLANGKKIDLTGAWNIYKAKEMLDEEGNPNILPDITFFEYYPTALFNAHLAPLRDVNPLAYLFYQGESNVERSNDYKRQYVRMCEDVRKLFANDKLPIIQTQLSAFSDGYVDFNIDWAIFREIQKDALCVDNSALVQSYDLGEYYDLHPYKKKELADRMYVAIKDLVYGETNYIYGPTLDKIDISNDKINVYFKCESKLEYKKNLNYNPEVDHFESGDSDVHGFAIKLVDGKIFRINGVITSDNCVTINTSAFADINKGNIDEISYMFINAPMEVNLYEGIMPAVPFKKKIK